jgi:hypothetical protein
LQPTGPSPPVPERTKERRDELRHLNNKIDAIRNLRYWNEAIRKTDNIPNSISNFYVIQYDPIVQKVSVEPSIRITQGSERVIDQELNNGHRDTVHVEIDRAEDLKDAYPNYFLDVGAFVNLLEGAVGNKTTDELERTLAPLLARPTGTPGGIWNFGRWRIG